MYRGNTRLKKVRDLFRREWIKGVGLCLIGTSLPLAPQNMLAGGSTARPSARDTELGEHLQDGDVSEPAGAISSKINLPAYLQNLYYVNGMNTTGPEAVMEARAIGERLGTKLRTVFTKLTVPVVDHLAIIADKFFNTAGIFNEAQSTLVVKLKERLSEGDGHISIIAYSGGAIVLLNALRSLKDDYEDDLSKEEQHHCFARIHVLTVGSAAFANDHLLADKWPKHTGSVFHLYHKKDLIAQLGGAADWGTFDSDAHRFVEGYVPRIEEKMLNRSGTAEIG